MIFICTPPEPGHCADGFVMTELDAALMTDVPGCSSHAWLSADNRQGQCYPVSRSDGKEHLLRDSGAPGQESWPGPHISVNTPLPPGLRCCVSEDWLYFITSLLSVICPAQCWPNTSSAWHPWAHFLPDTNRIWNNDCIRMGRAIKHSAIPQQIMMFVVHCLSPGGSGDLVLYQISWGALTRYVVIINSLMTAITVSSLPNDDHYHSGDKWYASDHAADVKHLRRGKTKYVNDKSHVYIVYCGSQFLWWTGRKLEKHLTVLVKIFKANKNHVF